MRKILPILSVLTLFCLPAKTQLLLYDDFNSYFDAPLAGQGGWAANEFATTISYSVASATPINGCTGSEGKYIVPTTPASGNFERVYRPTTNYISGTSQIFFLSFLLNLSSTGTDINAHIIGIGNDFAGTFYEFLRFHVRSAGSGYNIGVSKGGGTGLGDNSGGGISWGTTELSLNQTYHFVIRYDYTNGVNDDVIYAWIDPFINAGSEPMTAQAEITVASGTLGNDILFEGDNVRRVYLNYRSAASPVFQMDDIFYTRGATSATAWSNTGISETCSGVVPLRWISVTAAPANGDRVKIGWLVEEADVRDYTVQRSSEGSNFENIYSVASSGNGTNQYFYTDFELPERTTYYRILQTDLNGRISYSPILKVDATKPKTLASLYPNPVKNMAVLKLSDLELVNTNANIFDVTGRQLQAVRITSPTMSIDLSGYKPGIYFIKLVDGTTVRFLKN